MILQALAEYYERKPDLPRLGFTVKEIPYVIVLREDGTPANLEETYEGTGKSRRARQFLLPQAVKRSVGIAANLLWDNPEYALGTPCKGNPARVAKQHAAFIERIAALDVKDEPGLSAVIRFLSRPDKQELMSAFGPSWEELTRTGANLSFQLAGQTGLVAQQPAIKAAVAAGGPKTDTRICLVTGRQDTPERLHAAIKGVWGAQSTGGNIVSFNLEAFRSFNKDQGENAPVGKDAAFAYTTALNHLLSRDSKQRIQVGTASTVFWAKRAHPFEEQMSAFFSEPPPDDPDRNVRAVESLFKSVKTGAFKSEELRTGFYVLGLLPNSSRLVVQFWIENTIACMAKVICRHFDDMEIIHRPGDKGALSLFRLLVSVAPIGKAENILPNLSGDLMRAILMGLPYPRTLLQAAVRRSRAEQEITYPRAALIKACLNRACRQINPVRKEDLQVSLDIANSNIGYRLGRLFATLEKIQAEASPGINTTIRDRFYGAASSTPVTVFGYLMRLKNHHLAKIDNVGRCIWFEKLMGEILAGISDFPPHLRLDDQGRFAIGYYHQWQEFFIKKTASPAKEDDNE